MKKIQFDYCSEMVDYLGELLEEKDGVSIYCDYNIAVELLDYVHPDEFNDFDIDDLDESCDEYLVGKVDNVYFGIQKARNDNDELLYCENDYVVILDYIVDDEELDNFYGEVETCLVDFYEYDMEDEDELAEYNYDDEDETCDCIECTLNRYVEKISSLGLVCPHCVKECLESFMEEILD